MQRKVYDWENEADDAPTNIDYMQQLTETENAEDDKENKPSDVLKIVHQKPIEIKYNYKENEPGKN